MDYAAATPVRPAVLQLMVDVTKQLYANPSAIHKEGVAAKAAIEDSRLKLARTLRVRPEDIIFTGSGTESNNLAVYGLLRRLNELGKAFADMTVLSTKLEHPSVLEVLDDLSTLGVAVKYVEVDDGGRLDLNHFRSLLDESVVLCTFAYVNSEIGVVQDINNVSRLVKKFNNEKGTEIKVHTDAAQAPLWLSCRPDELGADMISLDAGKCYGPKGVGVLIVRGGVELSPVVRGGGQEQGLRAATENTPAIIGAVEALVIAQTGYVERAEKVSNLRDQAFTDLLEIEGLVVNGSSEYRVANNINISVPGVDGEFAVVTLDEAGFAVSTKSACSGAGGVGSKVVKEISGDDSRAAATIRITLGEDTTKKELKDLVKTLSAHVAKTRQAMGKF